MRFFNQGVELTEYTDSIPLLKFHKRQMVYVFLLCFGMGISLQAAAQGISQQDSILLDSLNAQPGRLLQDSTQATILERAQQMQVLNKYQECRHFLKSIEDVIDKAPSKNDYFQARIRQQLSTTEAHMGNAQACYRYGKQVLSAFENLPEPDTALLRNNYQILASASKQLGYREEALHYCDRWLQMTDEKETPLQKAHVLNMMGLIHSHLFNQRAAQEYFRQCYDLRAQHAPESLPSVINDIGLMYLHFQRYDSAIVWLKKGLEFRHSNLDEQILIHATLSTHMSDAYFQLGKKDSALQYSENALVIRAQYQSLKVDTMQMAVLDHIDILMNSENRQLAQAFIEEVTPFIQSNKNPALESRLYVSKAKMSMHFQQVDNAIRYYNLALHTLDTSFIKGSALFPDSLYIPLQPDLSLINTLESKADALDQQYTGQKDKTFLLAAIANMEKAVEYMNRYMYRHPGSISDPVVYYHQKRLVDKSLSLLYQLYRLDKEQVSLQTLSRLLEIERINSVRKNLIYQQLILQNPQADSLQKEWQYLNEALRIQASRNASDSSVTYDSLTEILHTTDIQFQQQFGNYHRLAIEESTTIPAPLPGSLSENKALVQYFFAGDVLHCIFATGPQFKWYAIPWESEQKKLLHEVQVMLRNPQVQTYDRLSDLGRVLLPFLKNVQPEELVIMPHGPLHHLPFEALKIREDYLIQHHSIAYLQSLARTAGPERKPRYFLGFAPFYSSGTKTSIGKVGVAYHAQPVYLTLHNSQDEITLTGGFFESSYFQGPQATEFAFRQSLAKQDIIHLATHTLLDDENPLFSRILLAKDSLHDGKLYIHELFTLPLQAQLVVLSACNQINQDKGEGLTSLATGFYMAGVNKLMLTHWPVPEGENTAVLEDFYKHWRKQGEAMPQALQSAKREYLTTNDEASQHPYYWAGLVLHQNQYLSDKGFGIPWKTLFSIMAVLTGLAFLFIFYKRRS
ncbi:CHAT domain-containing protein [Rapidithrix thailandica]|uniref:CHAT domain-containing protein n=1 Tax=Rapidithrix thailandica TaxID=413964 RepID=A0AAW9SLJ6_9BACT